MAKQCSKEEQHIHVSVRIRPNNPSEYEAKSFLEVLSKKEILSKTTYNQRRYVFDRVFDSHSSQQEVYTSIVSPLIPEVIGGYNCTVFAYGQTGTGKTYTMEGVHDKDNQISSGIIPRALSQIFKVLGNMHTESSIKVSYLELYNEELFDLLSQSTTSKAIKIYEDKAQKGSVILQGLEELSVTELSQVYKILEQGTEKRRIASTLMNSTSSRSHTVFTIVVHTREITVEGEELVKTGKLNLVDLAGSENISKSGAIDKRAREAGNINQSLLTLGRVIKALTEKNTHVPYRESKLTRILQDSLGGRTKTSLIATISSANIHVEETLNTLEYAMRARCIQNRPELNQKISRTALINQYSDTIEKLQRDLIAMRTGTGVYVDEDNYTKLVSDHEAQKTSITEKLGYIKKLEGEIADYTEKLHILQASWTEAANNIEHLSNEKKILEKDLIIVKELNEQQQRELNEYKDETEKLLSDVQKHSVNEDALHRKVSYLYRTSQNNKAVAKAFYNMYSKSYRELISGVEKCVNFTLNSVTNMDALFKDESKEVVYNNIITQVNSLLRLSNDIRDYKSRYFEDKDNLKTRFNGYFNSLQSLIDCVHERSVTFSHKFDESLMYLKSTVNSFSDEQDVDLKIILSSLFNIRESVDNEYLTMTNTLSEFHSTVFDKIDELISEIEYLKEENVENQKLIVTLQGKLNERYDTLLRDISEMKKSSIAELSNCELRQQKTATKCGSIVNKMETFKQSIRNTATTCRETFNEFNSTQLVQSSIVSLDKINEKAQLKKKRIVESTEERINDANVAKTNINRCFEEFKTDLSDSLYELHSKESSDDAHYDILDKITTEIYDTTEGIEASSQMIFNKQDELKNKIQHIHKETVDVLKDTLSFCNSQSKDLEAVLDEFCGCKLQYPTHVGDTPQKVQPKSSLYIQTLSRSFNDTDGGKNSRFHESVNKENLSNALNTMCPKENNIDT